MRSKLLTATGLALMFALPAVAQTTPHPGGNSQTPAQQAGSSSQNNMNVRQQITHDLQQAGFTGIQVMPESYLVRAKDKEGRPMMMVVNPDSVTAVTEVGGSAPSGSGGSGSGSTAPTTTK